ncbi:MULTISPECIES: hypothetical protein [Coprobacillaceae]|uniref:hypothetical protein n=1 Tax=Coprobacillaceae TaxID=2810280 RepID=UPI000E524D63|nr:MULTISPECIES: hypothetical protein [Coprobacillaceae]RHM63649.1 hypothetical protein DWZ53_00725 [Coprobacillus sp. AF33-1AC]RHS96378.1 hypothetical protein DW911_00725 [Erysipelatoclostridium sp. AM42-17]
MEKKEFNKLLLLSMGAYIIAGFMFAIGLIMKQTVLLITFYIIAAALMISGVIALFNNYKKNKIKLLLFLCIIGTILFILISTAMIASL